MLIRIRSQCQFILDCLIMSRKACLSFSVPCFRLLVYRTFFRPMREGGRRLNIGTRCSVKTLISEQEMEKIEVKGGVDKVNNDICNAILLAASQSIPKKGGKKKRKIVPWWTKECDKVIKSRNKAFKMLKKNHSFQNFIEYKMKQANVWRIIKNTKKEFWRKFCNTVGRETEIGQVWGMIKRMNGIKREFGYPILRDGDTTRSRFLYLSHNKLYRV